MALVLPFLMILLLGMWATARAYNVKNTLDHAVREAARYAATVDPWDSATSPAAVRSIADAELSAAAIPTGDVNTVCIEKIAPAATGCGGEQTNATPVDQVIVRLAYPGYTLEFAFFSMTVDLSASATARYES